MPPPFAGDAFRPLRVDNTVGHSMPAELFGWTFRHEGYHLGGLGTRQQEDRTRPRFVRRRPNQ
jgi:hypothetical protein